MVWLRGGIQLAYFEQWALWCPMRHSSKKGYIYANKKYTHEIIFKILCNRRDHEMRLVLWDMCVVGLGVNGWTFHVHWFQISAWSWNDWILGDNSIASLGLIVSPCRILSFAQLISYMLAVLNVLQCTA